MYFIINNNASMQQWFCYQTRWGTKFYFENKGKRLSLYMMNILY